MSYLEQCERFVARRLKEEARSSTRVYFVEAIGLGRIKIGKAANVKQRIAALECSSPARLRLIGDVPGGHFLESWLHHSLREYRIKGEWFTDNEAVRSELNRLLDSGARS